jgi:hypothetical protein
MAVSSQGTKKPLNALENPIYPDIRKGPPRFVWSKKFWQADPGAVLRDTGEIVQFYDDAVLAQSRDYNQTVYGQSSHKDIVNATFRPPLLDPIEDFFPLTRIPVTSWGNIVPTINPTTVADGGGTSGYLAKNEQLSDIDRNLNDRIKQGEWRATFYAPIEVPQDNAVLPDLEMTIPSVSAHAGFNPYTRDAPVPEVHLDYEKIHPSQHTGVTTQVTMDGGSGLEHLSLDYNNPQVPVTAGMNNPAQFHTETSVERELFYNNPQVSVTAGMNNPAQFHTETGVHELFNNGPQVSVDAGYNPDFQANNIETYIADLPYTRPQASVTAGMNTPYEIHGDFGREDIELETHIEAPLAVTNPGTEDGYRERMGMDKDPNEHIHENRPSFSYHIPETHIYKEQNELSYKPHARGKLQPLKSYGQISHAGAYKRGLDVPRKVSMRGDSGWANTPKIKNYSFGKR